MPGDLWLANSNILIRWIQPNDPGFAVVRASIEKLERSADVPCYTSQNLGELWNALTRPANRNGYGMAPREAHLHAISIERRFRLLPNTIAVHDAWRRLLIDHHISGVQVHDARLAASMLVHGVQRILTFNTRDFERYPGIKAIHPADAI